MSSIEIKTDNENITIKLTDNDIQRIIEAVKQQTRKESEKDFNLSQLENELKNLEENEVIKNYKLRNSEENINKEEEEEEFIIPSEYLIPVEYNGVGILHSRKYSDYVDLYKKYKIRQRYVILKEEDKIEYRKETESLKNMYLLC